jgi:hypothetical protein
MHAMADRPKVVLGLVATVAAVALAGCGGSSATSSTGRTTAESSATKAQFVTQAEAICRKLAVQEKPLKLREESSKHLTVIAAERAFIKLVGELVDFSNTAGSKLKALPRPPGDTAKIQQLLEAFRAETADVAEIARAVSHQEAANGEAAAASLKRSVNNNTLAAEGLGMKECLG